jgi:hypothetical protein
MAVKRYDGTQWVNYAGAGIQGTTGTQGVQGTQGIQGAGVQGVQGVQGASFTTSVTAAGDLIVATGSGAVTNLAAGTAGYALTANGAGVAPTYQAIPTGSRTLIASASPGAVATYTFSSIPNTYKDLYLVGVGIKFSTTHQIYLRAQGISGSNSYYHTNAGNTTSWSSAQDTGYQISYSSTAAGQTHNFQLTIYDYANSTVNDKLLYGTEVNYAISSAFNSFCLSFGAITGSNINAGVGAIDNITIQDLQNNGNFSAGTLYLYGVK